jgi:carboxyl-terminal processing protease
MDNVRAVRLWSVILALLAVVGGAGGSGIKGNVAPAWAAPAQQAAPGPFVQQAFDLLMDRYVTPPSSQTLLTGGWESGVRFVQQRANAAPEGNAPALTGDRGADWRAFMSAYPALMTALGGAAEQVDLDRAIISGMARSLDSVGTFLRPPDSGPLGPSSNFVGIGVVTTSGLIIGEVFTGSPAEIAGVRIGDRIISVNGVPVEGQTSQEVSGQIRGPAGEPVTLTFSRDGAPLTFTITRALVTVEWVSTQLLEANIGHIRFRQFPEDGAAALDTALAVVGGAPALVIDLRGNIGGFWNTLRMVASRFVPEGPVFETVNRQGQVAVQSTTGGFWGRNVPLAVIVNQGTTSEGETLAAVLRDRGSAVVVGTRTAGQAGGSSVLPLQDGSSLLIRTSQVRSSTGVMLTGAGVEPDIVVELDPAMLTQGKDSQMEAALTHLRGKVGQ